MPGLGIAIGGGKPGDFQNLPDYLLWNGVGLEPAYGSTRLNSFSNIHFYFLCCSTIIIEADSDAGAAFALL